MVHIFHTKLAGMRQNSKWPDQEEFAHQVGLSYGGYVKYENGTRIPSVEALKQICDKAGWSAVEVEVITELRDEAKAKQVGIDRPFGLGPTVDSDAVAKKIQNEVAYILKQDGVVVPNKTQKVIEKRIVLILKNTLGV